MPSSTDSGAPPQGSAAHAPQPADLEALRPALLKYARLQLRDEATAEDCVSDTLLAVLEKPQAFAGKSQLRTYVTGILKHKIIDVLRAGQRWVQISREDDESESDMLDALFDSTGHWREKPTDWGNPEGDYERGAFFAALEACVEKLPSTQGRLFMMREWMELETEEICKALGVTPTNAWVLLHRARARLRECLEVNWFGQAAKNT
ncbi:sigma-70 family RNA polymerase sigma factor [Piscinibacterium candidicorallinum]|uniref:Sigma-70 family RNA polymerase sigma factor n=1 Tax=Piscinibacterium candidicorallinum TaxID=1793872 RepID=A0ABV7HCK9_9BURK